MVQVNIDNKLPYSKLTPFWCWKKLLIFTIMTMLTVNINDKKSEKSVKDFLDSLGLNYTVDANLDLWQDENLVKELDKRSDDLKNGQDKGVSFSEIKNNL